MNGGLVLIPPTKQQTVHQSGATPQGHRLYSGLFILLKPRVKVNYEDMREIGERSLPPNTPLS